jgi:hypothetical protein
MDRSALSRFPSLQVAFDHAEHDPAKPPFLDELIDPDIDFHVQPVADALGRLLTRFTTEALDEQISAIFGDIDDWDKAATELLGLDLINSAGVLNAVGWPPVGKTPPFEAQLKVGTALFPLDIKSGTGSGLHILTSALRPIAQSWAATAHLGNVDLEIRFTSPITQQAVARHKETAKNRLRSALNNVTQLPFQTELTLNTFLTAKLKPSSDVHARQSSWLNTLLQPIVDDWAASSGLNAVLVLAKSDTKNSDDYHAFADILKRELKKALASVRSLPTTLELNYGTASFIATVEPHDGVTSHSGVAGVTPHAKTIEPTLRSHIGDKGDQARKHGSVPFLIAYVRLPGTAGGDISEHSLQNALRNIDQSALVPHPDLWLGTLLFDWARDAATPHREGFLRPDAAWPAGLTPQILKQRLGLTVWHRRLT